MTPPRRLLDPSSLHLSARRRHDKTTTATKAKTRRKEGKVDERGACRRKVEQICNSLFQRDVWDGNTQLPPLVLVFKATTKKKNKKLSICRAAEAPLQLGRTLIFKTGTAALDQVEEKKRRGSVGAKKLED